MAATNAQKERITAFNTALLAKLANLPVPSIAAERKMGLPPPATALGISRHRFMLSRKKLNIELTNAFYQPTEPVEKDEYGKLYDDGDIVLDYHLLTYKHINV